MDTYSESNVSEENGARSEQSARLKEGLRRDEFSAHLNQKLRTPLNAIMGFAELLEMQCENASMADNVKQILKAARALLDVINRELAECNHGNEASNVAPTSQCDVLYIEDDPANFVLVQRILEQRPAIKLLQATRGEMGLTLAETHGPRLILLDLNLPDMHGHEVLKRLKSDPRSVEIPVVVISADAMTAQKERLLAAGASEYLTKPLNVQKFLSVLDRSLENVSG